MEQKGTASVPTQLAFEDRVAVVTGAGSGMGREYGRMLASRGARVVVNDIDPTRAEDTLKLIEADGGQAFVDHSDICTGASALVRAAVDAFGGLDIVINNAGIHHVGMFSEQDPGLWWKIFDTHFRGTVEMTRNAWPWLEASGTGRIVNIGSSAMLPGPNRSAYGAGKAAIWGFTNSIALEASESGIQVNVVLPSSWTPMTESSFDDDDVRATMRDRMPAGAVAAFVTWLVHQDTRVHGECFQISGNFAGRARFGAMPRIKVNQSTPEGWTDVAAQLMAEQPIRGYLNSAESFRAELLLNNPALESVLSGSSVSLRSK